MLKFDNVSFSYPDGNNVFDGLSLEIRNGEFFGITGSCGSGKSTLLKLANGLLKPRSGKVSIDGQNPSFRKIGLVFQYPEHQLFEKTVLKDICFGPLNLGFSGDEALEQGRKAMMSVGLSPAFEDRSPFDLSGGEKRLAAIAGVLAMNPDILAFDEPVAGLDSKSHAEIMALLTRLNSEGKTIIMVSHEAQDIENYCSSVFSLSHGRK